MTVGCRIYVCLVCNVDLADNEIQQSADLQAAIWEMRDANIVQRVAG